MKIKRFQGIWLLAILLGVMPVFGQTPVTLNLDFKADVQANGVPTNITPDASLPPAMQAMVRKRVAEWRYSMPTWRGEPVPKTVHQRIVAEAVPASGGFGLRIKHVTRSVADNAMTDERRTPPAYPPELQRRGIGGTLVYSYKVGEDGTPQEIELVSPMNPDRSFRMLDAAGRAALAKWSLRSQKVNGVDCQVLMPMVFEVVKGTSLEPKQSSGGRGSTPHRPDPDDLCPWDPTLLTEVDGSML